MPITAIDAHVHIWDRTRGETFIAEKQFPALTGKAFLPGDLAPVLAETQAESAVLVHGPATVKHALHCLDLCHTYPVFRSVVGWVDLRDSNCAEQLVQQARNSAFRGVRFTPLLDADPKGYLQCPAAFETCAALRDLGALVEVLAPPPLFDAVAALARSQPGLPVVLAHFGLPDSDPAYFDNWQASMAGLARYPNLHVKVSGLPLTGDPARDRALTRTHLAVLLDLFGPDRLLYASNWPVATALATPGHWRIVLNEALDGADIPPDAATAIYRNNVLRLY